jgi:hypothetical protein
MCEAMVHQFEQQHGIPDKLLMAMAMVESGRSIPGKGVVPWPWTLNAQGKSYSFKTKPEAIKKVKELRRRGIKSIDVGCMQVNLKHHPGAFRSLEEAFDPMSNIAYAANFLRKKMEKLGGNWYGAVARYHSTTPRYNLVYKKRVMQAWAQVQVYQNLKKIYARVNEEGEFDTHLQSHEGQQMSIRIKFAPYTGLR